MTIIEREISGMRKEIPSGGTSIFYGGASRQVEIKALDDHGAFIMVLEMDVDKDELCINGSFLRHKA